jgi:hypothetical protein
MQQRKFYTIQDRFHGTNKVSRLAESSEKAHSTYGVVEKRRKFGEFVFHYRSYRKIYLYLTLQNYDQCGS